jgi:hypothetical protein
MSDVQLQRNRAAHIQYLYDLYNRDEAPIGLRSTYTGLYNAHCLLIGKEAADAECRDWHLTNA